MRLEEFPQHFNPARPAPDYRACPALLAWLRADLAGEPPPGGLDLAQVFAEADPQGLDAWVAYRLLDPAQAAAPPAALVPELKQRLHRASGEKLASDLEWAGICGGAEQRGIRLLAIKGEGLARSLYPNPACRLTADFDLLVHPGDVQGMRELLAALGYLEARAPYGEHIFGEKGWYRPQQRGRQWGVVVDLHWDLTNRRFLRRRVPLAVLFERATPVDLDGATLWTLCHPHALLMACLHLAAAPRTEPLPLRWLLDIHLLLEALDDAQMRALADEARAWRLADVLGIYCALTLRVLGTRRHRALIESLGADISEARRRTYRWACDHRWFDFLEYALRLDGSGRAELLRQMWAFRGRRRKARGKA